MKKIEICPAKIVRPRLTSAPSPNEGVPIGLMFPIDGNTTTLAGLYEAAEILRSAGAEVVVNGIGGGDTTINACISRLDPVQSPEDWRREEMHARALARKVSHRPICVTTPATSSLVLKKLKIER